MSDIILSTEDYKEFEKDQKAINIFTLVFCSGIFIILMGILGIELRDSVFMHRIIVNPDQLISIIAAAALVLLALIYAVKACGASVSPMDIQSGTVVDIGSEGDGAFDEVEFYMVATETGNQVKCMRCPTDEIIIPGEQVFIWKTEATKETNYLCPDPRLRETKTITVEEEEKIEMDKNYCIKITYSWGDKEAPIEVGGKESAWNMAVELAGKEAAEAGLDNDSSIGLYFAPDQSRITLHYEYDDSYCYYDIVPVE